MSKFLRPKSQYSHSQCQTAATLAEKNKFGFQQKTRANLESAISRESDFSQTGSYQEARKQLKTAGITRNNQKSLDKSKGEKLAYNSKYNLNRPSTQQQLGRNPMNQRKVELLQILEQNKNYQNQNDKYDNLEDMMNSQIENRIKTKDSQQKINKYPFNFSSSKKSQTQQSANKLKKNQQLQQSANKLSNQKIRHHNSTSEKNIKLNPQISQQDQDISIISEQQDENSKIKRIGFDMEINKLTERDLKYIKQEQKKQAEFEKKNHQNVILQNEKFQAKVLKKIEQEQKKFEQMQNQKLKEYKLLQGLDSKEKQKQIQQNANEIAKNISSLNEDISKNNQIKQQDSQEEKENNRDNLKKLDSDSQQQNQQQEQEESFDPFADDDSDLEEIIIEQAPEKEREFELFYDNENNIRDQLVEQKEQYNEKFEQLKKNDENFKIQQIKQRDEDLEFLKQGENYLSYQEIAIIKEEYNRHENSRDYNALDEIIMKLKFFQQFSKHTRIYLLKLANIASYEQGLNIFKQGDEGDLMYIIIKGAVHVRIRQEDPDGTVNNPVVVTLYDGAQFGELALNAMENKQKSGLQKILEDGKPVKDIKTVKRLLQEAENEQQKQEETKRKMQRMQQDSDTFKEQDLEDLAKQVTHQKRAATIQTAEHTILFTISKQQYQSIVVNMMKKDLDDKLKVLKTISFLDFFSSVQLITLAKHIEVEQYNLGDIILKEGAQPKYFYIIAKGRVKLVREEVFVRKNELLGLESKFSKKRFNFGLQDYKNIVKKKIYNDHEILQFDQQFQLSNSDQEAEEEKIQNKTEQYQKIYSNDEKMMFKYQFDFGNLADSEIFMGRSFLMEYLKVDPKYSRELGGKNVYEPAKLTVVADSAKVEIYKIDKSKIYEIPEVLRKILIDGLSNKKEYDWEYDENITVDEIAQNNKKDSTISFNQYMMANFGKKWQKVWESYKQSLIQQFQDEKKARKSLLK